MRRLWILSLLLLTVPLTAQTRYSAYEQVTVANSAIGFTSATILQGNGHQQANTAVCRLETAQIRYRVDGSDPTTTVGTPLEVGDILTLDQPDLLVKFRAIRTGGTSGVLNCSYFAL